MTRQALQPEGVATPKPPFSHVVVSDDLVLTAGQVGFDADGVLVSGGIAEQTQRALENLQACLAAAGCGLEEVLRVGAFLASLDDFEGYNDVYREFFEPPYPARTTVGASLPGGILVEIEAVARRPA